MDILNNLLWWHWLVLGMGLLIVEIVLPASFFLWIALAALGMALISLFANGMSWELQIILFGVLSVASLFAGRAWFRHRPIATDTPQLNRRGDQYIGRTFTLTQAIVNGYGAVQVEDTRWRVSGPPLQVGDSVKVTGINGTTFVVEAA